jgi:hypothetical protein
MGKALKTSVGGELSINNDVWGKTMETRVIFKGRLWKKHVDFGRKTLAKSIGILAENYGFEP